MLAETVRRILAAGALFAREPREQQRESTSIRFGCSWQDQTVLAEAILAVSSNRSFLDWECLYHPVDAAAWRDVFGSTEAMPRPIGNPRRQFSPWRLRWQIVPGVPRVAEPPTREQARRPPLSRESVPLRRCPLLCPLMPARSRGRAHLALNAPFPLPMVWAVNPSVCSPQLVNATAHPLLRSPNSASICRRGEPACAERLLGWEGEMARRQVPEEMALWVPPGWTPLPRAPQGEAEVEWAMRGPQYLLDHSESLTLQWNDRAPTWSIATHIVRLLTPPNLLRPSHAFKDTVSRLPLSLICLSTFILIFPGLGAGCVSGGVGPREPGQEQPGPADPGQGPLGRADADAHPGAAGEPRAAV